MTKQALDDLYGLDPEGRPGGMLGAALAFILRHAIAVTLTVLALTAASGYLASTLDLVTDFAQLIPENTRSVLDRREGEKYLGNTSLLVLVVDAEGDNAGERAKSAAAALSERLQQDPEFDFVLHRFSRQFFERNALLYMSKEDLEDLHRRLDERITAEVLKENPLFVDLAGDLDDDDDDDESSDEPDIFDPDTIRDLYFEERNEIEAGEFMVDEAGTTYLVLARPVKPPVEIAYNKEILSRARDHVDALELETRFGPTITVTFSGNYWSTTEENDAVKGDLEKAGIFSGVMLLLVVLFYFRRLRAVWIVFLPLLSGVLCMMGYVKLAVGQLNTITGFCFALFMGLSIDFAIHFLARYDEERGRGQSVFDALLRTYNETGRASLSAAATSSVGFLALVAADFKGFREFGIIAGGGIVICLLVIAVLQPAIIALSMRFGRERSYAKFNSHKAAQRQRSPFARALVAIGVVLLVVLAWRVSHLEWEDDFRNLRGGSAENLETADRVRAILGRSTQPAVRIADSLAESARLAQACNDQRDQLGEASTVQHCLSLADFLPEDQDAKLPIIARIKGLLTDNRLDALDDEPRDKLRELRDESPSAPLTQADLPEEITISFVTNQGDKYLMKAYPQASTWLASNNIRFSEELMAGDDVSETDVGPIGTSMIMADLMRVMRRDSIVVVTIALIAVFCILLLLFRTVTKALACYLPLLIGLVATLGAMELLGWRLGLFNMIVLPSLIGLGVDNNIHLFHRYHTEGRGSWPYTIRTTGVACLMAAVTTMAGFAGLILAGHRGLNTIGDLAILGIIIATVISLVFLPAAMSLLESRVSGTGFGAFPGHDFDRETRRGNAD